MFKGEYYFYIVHVHLPIIYLLNLQSNVASVASSGIQSNVTSAITEPLVAIAGALVVVQKNEK